MTRWSRWLPTVIWTAMIFWFSSRTFSAANTEGWIVGMLRSILPFAADSTLGILHIVIRKLGHVVNYAILFACWWRTRRHLPEPQRSRGAFGFSVVTAGLDELNQTFTPTRLGSLGDVILDATGAALAWVALLQFARRKIKG